MTKANETHEQTSAAGSYYFGKRLIFFGAAENKTEPALLQLFSKHGEVSHMFIVRSALGISSGCGYVTFATGEQAAAALKALHGSTECAEAGATLGLLLVLDSPSSTSSSSSGAAGDTAPSSDNGSVQADGSSTGAHTQQEKLGKSVSRQRR
jgi:RNA recognition motif-containing protein